MLTRQKYAPTLPQCTHFVAYETHHCAFLQSLILRLVVGFPFGNIVFDVFGNLVHFVLVADDVVVETGLPLEWNVVLTGKSCDGLFETAHCN